MRKERDREKAQTEAVERAGAVVQAEARAAEAEARAAEARARVSLLESDLTATTEDRKRIAAEHDRLADEAAALRSAVARLEATLQSAREECTHRALEVQRAEDRCTALEREAEEAAAAAHATAAHAGDSMWVQRDQWQLLEGTTTTLRRQNEVLGESLRAAEIERDRLDAKLLVRLEFVCSLYVLGLGFMNYSLGLVYV